MAAGLVPLRRLAPHHGPLGVGQLDGHRSDAAAGAEDEHAIVGAQAGPGVERVPGRHAGHPDAGRLSQVRALRQLHHGARRHDGVLLVEPLAHHADATTRHEHRPAVDVAGPLGPRHPGKVGPGRARRTAGDPDVERVHRGEGHVDQDLAVAGDGVVDGVDLEVATDLVQAGRA